MTRRTARKQYGPPCGAHIVFSPSVVEDKNPVDGGRPGRRPAGALRASKIAPGDFVDSSSGAAAIEAGKRPSHSSWAVLYCILTEPSVGDRVLILQYGEGPISLP